MVSVSSTWKAKPSNLSDLADVHIVESDQDLFAFDPDTVSPERCFCLVRPDDTDPWCSLEVRAIPMTASISRLVLASESTTVEVYLGEDCHEYLQTSTGQKLPDSTDDLQVYLAEFDLRGGPRMLRSLKLRMRLPPEKGDSCWVVALLIGIEERKVQPLRRFDLANLDTMLAGVELSGAAKQFRQLFESFQKSSGPADLLASSVATGAMPVGAKVLPAPSENCFSEEEKTLPVTKKDLRDLEDRLCARIEAVAASQDAKLDQMISLLQHAVASRM